MILNKYNYNLNIASFFVNINQFGIYLASSFAALALALSLHQRFKGPLLLMALLHVLRDLFLFRLFFNEFKGCIRKGLKHLKFGRDVGRINSISNILV